MTSEEMGSKDEEHDNKKKEDDEIIITAKGNIYINIIIIIDIILRPYNPLTDIFADR
jgi:uncharacterized metal-binding protein YceD (DUF177 family)